MIKKWLKDYVEINKREIVFVISFLLLGIIIGIGMYIFSSTEIKETLIKGAKQVFDISKDETYLKTNIILNGIKQNTIIILILAILSVTLFGKWIIYGIVILKGMALSIYTIILFNIFGPFWGILVTFLLIILVNLIYLPAYIYIVVCFLEINFNIFKIKIKDKGYSFIYKTIFSVIIAFSLILSSVILEQITSPIVLSIYNKI